MIIAF